MRKYSIIIGAGVRVVDLKEEYVKESGGNYFSQKIIIFSIRFTLE